MRQWTAAVLGSAILVGSAISAQSRQAELNLQSVNEATLSDKVKDGISPAVVKAQVLLDRAHFSPGVIDGYVGDNLHIILKAYEKAHGLPVDGELDDAVWRELTAGEQAPVLKEYKVRAEDVKGPFLQALPQQFEDEAKLEHLSYTSPKELLAEKFHMDEDLLGALNPGVDFSRAGTRITVANVEESHEKDGGKPTVSRIEVDKGAHVLRAFGPNDEIAAVYPATIGSEEKPAPDGTLTVRAIAENPTYTYNPKYDFHGVRTKEPFVIAAGPNNPVGSVWIDLSADSFGIHGTPEPAKVGKTYSHGCVRLTNWDAEALAGKVHKGMKVTFLD